MKTETTKTHGLFLIILFAAIASVFIFYFIYNSGNDNSAAENMLDSVTANPHIINAGLPAEARTEFSGEEPEKQDIQPEENPPSEPVEYRISFTGTGDNLVHELIWMDARNRALPDGRAFNFKPIFADVAGMIANADIAFINQETPMAGSGFAPSGYPLFNSPQELGHDLAELGFDVINVANNHMLDKGETGLINTVNFLRSLDTTPIGDYMNREELYEIKVIERGGIKVAFLAYTYGTNGLVLPAGSELVIPYIDDGLIISQIAKAKEAADAVLVSIHWGPENVFNPTDEQRRLAQLMADHGVLAIIGHHPHVLQPIEWIEGSGGGRTLCVYSLGNFASGMTLPANMVGGFISFDIVMRGGIVTLEEPVFTPTIYYYARSWFDGHVYLLKDYTPELAASHGTQTRHGRPRTVEQLWEYVTRNIDAEFLR